jgi:hypothetical protein
MIVLYNGTTTQMTEYAVECSNANTSSIGTFYSTMSGSVVQLYYNPNYTSNNAVIAYKTALTRLGGGIPPDLISGTGTIDLSQGSGIIDLN